MSLITAEDRHLAAEALFTSGLVYFPQRGIDVRATPRAMALHQGTEGDSPELVAADLIAARLLGVTVFLDEEIELTPLPGIPFNHDDLIPDTYDPRTTMSNRTTPHHPDRPRQPSWEPDSKPELFEVRDGQIRPITVFAYLAIIAIGLGFWAVAYALTH